MNNKTMIFYEEEKMDCFKAIPESRRGPVDRSVGGNFTSP